MKALLLAAGVGSRIANEIGHVPKSTLNVDGKPLIIHTVELLQRNHIEVVVITGFKHRIIENMLKNYRVKVYYNPFFRVTNSIGSIWYAREEFFDTNEMIIANADVFYNQDILDIIFNANYNAFLLSDNSRKLEGDYFFKTEDGILINYGKDLPLEGRDCEYVGIGVLKGEWIVRYYEKLCEMIENGQYDVWWENVLYSFSAEKNINTVDVDHKFWAEVDTISDYQRVLKYCEGLNENQ